MDWEDDSCDEWLVSPAAYYAERAASGSLAYDCGRSGLKGTLVNAPNR
jgi:hypothetical protein